MLKIRRARYFPVSPYLISLYFIFSLLGQNIEETLPSDVIRSLLVSILLITAILLGARLAFGEWVRAALFTTLFSVFFFSYGHLYAFLKPVTVSGLSIGRHRLLLPVWILILLAGGKAIKDLRETAPIIVTLNTLGLLLLVIPFSQLVSYQVGFLRAEAARPQIGFEDQHHSDAQSLPDIYYIILDAYTREDTLLEVYSFDNRPFLDDLADRNFFVASCSRSNYPRTFLSVSSSLNFEFVQQLSPRNDGAELNSLIRHSAVRLWLENLGYSTVAFDPGYSRTQWPDADTYIAYQGTEDRLGGRFNTISEFERIFIFTTAGMLLFDTDTVLGGDLLTSLFESWELERHNRKLERYNRVRFILDALESVPEIPGPKFVFAHIPAPHEPYVFSARGQFVSDQDVNPAGYRNQLIYLNNRITDIVDTILAGSDVPPIIILQGDHGGTETKLDLRRLNIINAYYLPGNGQDQLYPSITPINTFRVIFDHYFDGELGLLPDISYFSTPGNDYDFSEAQEISPVCNSNGG